jgi:uncharacterized protein with HEPN domain
MSEKDSILIEDILDSASKIEAYIEGVTFDLFANDDMRIDAVVRNLEIIGEAAKSISEGTKSRLTQIDWKGMAGMRDRLIHAYHSVDVLIVWKTVSERLPSISVVLRCFLKNNEKWEQ